MSQFLDLAVYAAKEAGEILNHYFSSTLNIEVKEDSTSLVSVADKEAEKKIIKIIHTAYPDHDILAEESGDWEKESSYRWIIDPLDGTSNFLFGVGLFCVSIALEYEGEIIVGVVYDPVHDKLYTAEKGKGAFVNGMPISASAEVDFSKQFFFISIGSSDPKVKKQIATFISLHTHKIRRWREIGSAALKLCMLAEGNAASYITFGVSLWDVAAGKLILEEAGGCVTLFAHDVNKKSSHRYSMVATNAHVHQEVLDMFHSV